MPEIIIVPALFTTIGFIVWVVVNGWQRRHHLRLMTDFNSRLLDRIGSVKDFSEFLQTEGGAKLLESLTIRATPRDLKITVLRTVQSGIVTFVLGLGFLYLAWHFAIRYSRPDYEAFTVVGVIFVSLGVGFLVSGGVAYRLATRVRDAPGRIDG
jgi:hypothetical protein